MRLFILVLLSSIFCNALESTKSLPLPWTKSQFEKLDAAEIALGQKLFFDPILSKNKKISCASCHDPSFSFSNGQRLAVGLGGQSTKYNVPVLFNRFNSSIQFWDGRVPSLREQIFHPIEDKIEMGLSSKELLKRLSGDTSYRKIYAKPITRDVVEGALSSFISSLVSGNSKFDRYTSGEILAMSASELEGKKLFFEKFACVSCHSGPNFTNESLSVRCNEKDDSKYAIRYKVPTLRNLATSFPYLHNGRLDTLEEVLDLYGSPGGGKNSFTISPKEKKLLIEFLNTLNSEVVLYNENSHK